MAIPRLYAALLGAGLTVALPASPASAHYNAVAHGAPLAATQGIPADLGGYISVLRPNGKGMSWKVATTTTGVTAEGEFTWPRSMRIMTRIGQDTQGPPDLTMGIDASGTLWFFEETYGEGNTRPQLIPTKVSSGWGDVVSMVGSMRCADKTNTAHVYMARKNGTLTDYTINCGDRASRVPIKVAVRGNKGWGSIRAMGQYYHTGLWTKHGYTDAVLALSAKGELIRYLIPEGKGSISKTVLKPGGWGSIAGVHGGFRPNGANDDFNPAKPNHLIMAVTTSGEGRVYHEANAGDATGNDITYTGVHGPAATGAVY